MTRHADEVPLADDWIVGTLNASPSPSPAGLAIHGYARGEGAPEDTGPDVEIHISRCLDATGRDISEQLAARLTEALHRLVLTTTSNPNALGWSEPGGRAARRPDGGIVATFGTCAQCGDNVLGGDPTSCDDHS